MAFTKDSPGKRTQNNRRKTKRRPWYIRPTRDAPMVCMRSYECIDSRSRNMQRKGGGQ